MADLQPWEDFSPPSPGPIHYESTTTWPADANFPPVLTGTQVNSNNYDGVTGTYTSFTVPAIYNDYCRVASLLWVYNHDTCWLPDLYLRNAQATWKLKTGGKALSHRKNLFVLTATATEITDKRARPPFDSLGSEFLRAIPATNIALGKLGYLDSDSNLYAALADNADVDVTPLATNREFYTFTVTPTKHKLDIDGDANLDGQITDDDADEALEKNSPAGILVPVFTDMSQWVTLILRKFDVPSSIPTNYSLRLRLVNPTALSVLAITNEYGNQWEILDTNHTTWTIPRTGPGLSFANLMQQDVELTVQGNNAGQQSQLYFELLKDGQVILDDWLNLTVCEVTFDKDPSQRYGYDKYATNQHPPNWDFLSVKKSDWTTFKATVTPASVAPYVWYTPDDPTITLTPNHPGSANPTIGNICGDFSGSSLIATNFARLGPNGLSCGKLEVRAYAEKSVDIYYYRVQDTNSPGTGLSNAPNPTLNDIKTNINTVWKQAVLNVESVSGDTNSIVHYDFNFNGVLDIFTSGSDQEFDALKALVGRPAVAFVKAVRWNYRLTSISSNYVIYAAGSWGANNICSGTRYVLGYGDGSNDEEVTIASVDTNSFRIYFTNSLANTHSSSEFLKKDKAGASDMVSFMVVTDEGGDLKGTICHELLHLSSLGQLADLSDQGVDNVMYYKIPDSPGPLLLRAREIDHQYGDGPCGSPASGTDKQWDMIPR